MEWGGAACGVPDAMRPAERRADPLLFLRGRVDAAREASLSLAALAAAAAPLTAAVLRELRRAPDQQQYSSARRRARSADGLVDVPYTLQWRTDRHPPEGPADAPVLLTAYGAYGRTLHTSSVRRERAPLLDRGVVLATAEVRGGGARGGMWHALGRVEGKAAAVGDVLACAAALRASGVAAAGRVALEGRSAGGGLVAAAANRAPPGAFCGALLVAPLVDALTQLAEPGEAAHWPEFGCPHTRRGFDALRSWSPYENAAAHFPPALIVAGASDARVPPWGPLRFYRRLRDGLGVEGVYFRLVEGGHECTSSSSSEADGAPDAEVAAQVAFLLWALGVKS